MKFLKLRHFLAEQPTLHSNWMMRTLLGSDWSKSYLAHKVWVSIKSFLFNTAVVAWVWLNESRDVIKQDLQLTRCDRYDARIVAFLWITSRFNFKYQLLIQTFRDMTLLTLTLLEMLPHPKAIILIMNLSPLLSTRKLASRSYSSLETRNLHITLCEYRGQAVTYDGAFGSPNRRTFF